MEKVPKGWHVPSTTKTTALRATLGFMEKTQHQLQALHSQSKAALHRTTKEDTTATPHSMVS
jgi:hypothetical protein